MRRVVIEFPRSGAEWSHLGEVCEVEPAGSMSSDHPEGRELYSFGWIGDDGPAVWRSVAGFDIANQAVREIYTEGLELIGDLLESPCTIDFWRRGRSVPIRFRLVEK